MKTIKNILNKAAGIFAVVFLLSFTTASFGQTEDKTNYATLQFVGKVDRLPVFRLVILNEKEGSFLLKVKQGNGDVIFSEKLKGNSIAKLYKLDTENTELINATTFEVTNAATNKTTVYKLNNYLKTVEEVFITKL